MEIRLGDRRPARTDEMGRTGVGFDSRKPPEVLFEQNRGRWRVDQRRALEQDYVLFTWTGTAS